MHALAVVKVIKMHLAVMPYINKLMLIVGGLRLIGLLTCSLSMKCVHCIYYWLTLLLLAGTVVCCIFFLKARM